MLQWLFVEAMLLLFAGYMLILYTVMYGGLNRFVIFWVFSVGLVLWYAIEVLRRRREFERTAIRDIEADPRENHSVVEGVRSEREPPSSQNLNLFLVSQAHMLSVAMRALPPVLCFKGDHESHCSICMEEFKNGELVQPFGVCLHQFHLHCINSWLRLGKPNCPLCRKELTITH